MKKLLSNLFSGAIGKLFPSLFRGFGNFLGYIGKGFLSTWEKWDWGDRITAFLVAMVLIGGIINANLKIQMQKVQKENEVISQEIILQRTFVTELQTLLQGQTAQTRQLKATLDSAYTANHSLTQDNQVWQQVTQDTQRLIRDLVQQRDSLRKAKTVTIYTDRCFNALGKEVDCSRRRSR